MTRETSGPRTLVSLVVSVGLAVLVLSVLAAGMGGTASSSHEAGDHWGNDGSLEQPGGTAGVGAERVAHGIQNDIVEVNSGGDGVAGESMGFRRVLGDGSPAIASRFDSGTDGWRITGDAQGEGSMPEYVETGGKPGGHVCADDNVAGGTWYFSAPSKFLGDRSDAYGGTLAFDLNQSSTDSQFAQDDVVLRNGTKTIVYDFGDADAHPNTNWTSYDVPLTAADAHWTDDSGDAVSPQAFRTLLSNLTGLAIRGEYVSGEDRGCLDNVVLSETGSSATVDVTLARTSSPVRVGETLSVEVTVENTGESTGTASLALSTDGVERDATSVALEPGESRTVELAWRTATGDAGEYTATVRSGADSDSMPVTVLENRGNVTVESQEVADVETQSVVVDSASLPDLGFLVVYNGTVGSSVDSDAVIGVSSLLDAGQHEHVRIALAERIPSAATVTVVIHNDTNGNTFWDGPDRDRPFTTNGDPVKDEATVTMRDATTTTTTYAATTTTLPPTSPPSTHPPTTTLVPTTVAPESTTTSSDGLGTGTESGDAPGLGGALAVISVLAATILAVRNRD